MKSLVRLSSVAFVALAAQAFAGCAVDSTEAEKEDVSAEDLESALSGGIRDLGEIPGTGESRTARHAAPPKYAGYTFYADGGDEVDAWVRASGSSDPVAWILDARNKQVAFNDDAPEGGTLASHLVKKLPATLGKKAKLRVVFRDYRLAPATYTVSVRVKPGMLSCTVDADCAKVSVGGCCTAWQSTAVNATRAEDYAAQNQCKPPYPPCAPPPRDLLDAEATKVARCEKNQCVLGAPRGCTYDGTTHAVGESFPSTDGCNTCSCGSDGSVGCTKRACVPTCDPANEPNKRYVGTSREQCMVVRFACIAGTTSFIGDCGCGCEQPANCPASIDCKPGANATTCAAERARCPFTPVAL